MANEFVARNGVIAQNNSVITGSLVVTNGITGSMFGTSSRALTSSYSQTSSYANTFTVGGTLTAQTLIVSTISSSVEYSSGSNIFGNSLTNTQQLTGSTSMTGSLTVYGNTVMTGSLNVSGSITTTGALSGTSGTFSADITALHANLTSNSANVNAVGITATTGYSSAINWYRAGYANWYIGSPSNSTSFSIGQDNAFTTPALTFAASNAAIFSSSVTATSGTFSSNVTLSSASASVIYLNNTTATTGKSWNIVSRNDGYFLIGIYGVGNYQYFDPSGNSYFASTLAVQGTTASTSYTTGALVVSGGVGIAGAVYVNSTINVAGAATFNSSVTIPNNTSFAFKNAAGSGNAFDIYSDPSNNMVLRNGGQWIFNNGSSNVVTISNSGAATFASSVTANSIIGGDASFTDSLTVTNNFIVQDEGANSGQINFGQNYGPYLYYDGTNTFGFGGPTDTQIFLLPFTTTSSDYTTGALVVGGGVGIAGAVHVNSSVTANSFTGSLLGTASFAKNATSASYAISASYASRSLSASYALTASYANSFTVGGTLTAQTLIVQTITSSIEYSSGSNIFGNSLANTQTFTGSINITGSSHTIIGSSSFNGNMVITGSITAGGALSGTSASFSGTLGVTGAATFANYGYFNGTGTNSLQVGYDDGTNLNITAGSARNINLVATGKSVSTGYNTIFYAGNNNFSIATSGVLTGTSASFSGNITAASYSTNTTIATNQIYLNTTLSGDGLIIGSGRGSDALIVGNKASGAGNLLALDYAGANKFNVDYTGAATFSSSIQANALTLNTSYSNFGISTASDGEVFVTNYAVGYGSFKKLHFAGSVHIFDASGVVTILSTTASTSYTTGALVVSGGVGIAGAVYVNSSVTATAFYNSSDITLKDIISEDGDVIRYKWKDGRDDLIHIGYSAQEKQLLYPDQTISGENNKLTLNYTEILVDKVRQLEKKVESLKNLIK